MPPEPPMPQPPTPFLVALDSSHWSNLTVDLRSGKHRDATLRRLKAFEANGGVFVFTFHHLMELIQHENEAECRGRLEALRSVSNLTTVVSAHGEGAGSIADVVGRELRAALNAPDSTAQDVLASVRSNVFEPTSGDAISAWFLPQFDAVRQEFLARPKRSREIAAISQAQTLDRSRDKLDLNAKGNSLPQAQRKFEAMRGQLAAELVSRRQDRSSETEAIANADAFVDDLLQDAPSLVQHATPWDGILAMAGLTRQDAEGMRTVGELTDLAHFRRLLSISGRSIGISNEAYVKARQDQFPTWLIHRAYLRHRQLATNTSGSDLTDIHLVCHAPYVDACFVDKRTGENVRRVRGKDPEAAAFLKSVQRAPTWYAALEAVDKTMGKPRQSERMLR